MLADIRVHLEDAVGSLGSCGGIRLSASAIALLGLDFGHIAKEVPNRVGTTAMKEEQERMRQQQAAGSDTALTIVNVGNLFFAIRLSVPGLLFYEGSIR